MNVFRGSSKDRFFRTSMEFLVIHPEFFLGLFRYSLKINIRNFLNVSSWTFLKHSWGSFQEFGIGFSCGSMRNFPWFIQRFLLNSNFCEDLFRIFPVYLQNFKRQAGSSQGTARQTISKPSRSISYLYTNFCFNLSKVFYIIGKNVTAPK